MKNFVEYIFLIGIILFTFSGCEKPKKNNDLKRLNLSGNVKSIIETKNRVTKPDDSLNRDLSKVIYIVHFNKQGFKTLESREYVNNIINSKIKYNYPNDSTVVQLMFDSQDSLQVKSIYTNNEKYDPICIEVFDSQDSLQAKGDYFYNSEGLLTNFLSYDHEGDQINKEKYSYDVHGNLIMKHIIENYGESFKYGYKNDSLGNMIELTIYKNDSLFSQKSSYSYEFDSQGNWIRRIEFVNGNEYEQKKRDIIYY